MYEKSTDIEVSLDELQVIIQSRDDLVIEVDSPDGFVLVNEFVYHGIRPCVRVTLSDCSEIECSIDHWINIPLLDGIFSQGLYWREAQELRIGEEVISECGHMLNVISIVKTGIKSVFDLVVDHKSSVGHHRFYADGKSVHNCNACGECTTVEEVRSITSLSTIASPSIPGSVTTKELGSSHLSKITSVKRDNDPFTKMLVEARIESGKYGAMTIKWLMIAMTRAIMKAGDTFPAHLNPEGTTFSLVEPCIGERSIHSRQGWKVRPDDFISLVSGSFIIELSFNRSFPFTEEHRRHLLAHVNDHVTEGWSISNISLKSGDFTLKSVLDLQYIEYRFDSRRVPKTYHFDYLKESIERLQPPRNERLKYRDQKVINRDIVRSVKRDYPISELSAFGVTIGRDSYETILRVMAPVKTTHPFILLTGIVGGDKFARPNSALRGCGVSVLGFYKKGEFGGSVFESDSGGSSTICPSCGKSKLINIMSGHPFGYESYEKNGYLLHKYGIPVCQNCFSKEASG
jgi:hypothetical protein